MCDKEFKELVIGIYAGFQFCFLIAGIILCKPAHGFFHPHTYQLLYYLNSLPCSHPLTWCRILPVLVD